MEAEALKTWREERNLTREDLARLLSTSYATVFRWEKGERSIPAYLDLALKELARTHKADKAGE